MIIKQLNKQNFKDISTINRAQLIDDALNLARAGRLDYNIAFDVTSYLAHETEYLPWKAAFNGINYLNDMLIKTQGYDKFRVSVHRITAVGFASNFSCRLCDYKSQNTDLPCQPMILEHVINPILITKRTSS